MFTKFINLPVFIISFIIGFVFINLSVPATTTVFVYPTPDNIRKIEYIDKAGNCFEYIGDNVDCPDDVSKIKNIPPQMGRTAPKKIQTSQINIGTSQVNKI